MKALRFALLTTLAVSTVACSTTGRFVVPPNTQLEVYKRPVAVNSDGTVTTRPFFWTAAGVPPGGGIEYRLLNGQKVVKEGRLRTKFRVVSIFWPPFAAIYWPMGFNGDITYDLVKDTQK